MAHKKAQGATSQQTTRPGRRLGVKKFGGESIKTGGIIVRQKGTKFHPGDGVGMGRDYTIFALQDGLVKFLQRQGKKIISVVSK